MWLFQQMSLWGHFASFTNLLLPVTTSHQVYRTLRVCVQVLGVCRGIGGGAHGDLQNYGIQSWGDES